MRKSRVIESGSCYHLISRLAHRAFFLDDWEKTHAVELLRRVEEFSGVVVLAYAIMSNHFHVFVYVPKPMAIDDDEILRRINALYLGDSLSRVLGEWTRLKGEEERMPVSECVRAAEGCVSRFGEYRKSFLRRMWNSSEFMRTYKQHFTMSFNGRRDHHGTMFEGRYNERHHKPDSKVMWRTSAYIDVNACKAGLVSHPEDYEWCSFAAAVKGDEMARRGYAFMYGNADDWNVIRECHEKSMRGAMSEILSAREVEGDAARGTDGDARSSVKAQSQSKVDQELKMPKPYGVGLERGNPEVVDRVLKLLGDGPMRPSAIRKAIGIRSSIHFNRYYLAPLLSKGVIVRTDPQHPKSPQQKYRLA